MSAGLAASTVTPGNTAPDVSRTTPVIDACAWASEGAQATIPAMKTSLARVPIHSLLQIASHHGKPGVKLTAPLHGRQPKTGRQTRLETNCYTTASPAALNGEARQTVYNLAPLSTSTSCVR